MGIQVYGILLSLYNEVIYNVFMGLNFEYKNNYRIPLTHVDPLILEILRIFKLLNCTKTFWLKLFD